MPYTLRNFFNRFFSFHTAWKVTCFLLLLVSSTYLVWGTPARLRERFPDWQPDVGTLNGLEYMRQGSYTWPPRGRYKGLSEVRIELRYDWEAIQWLLENVRGNLVIVEAAETDFYLAGGTRIASMTGLSGLNGFHAGEQHYASMVAERSALHIEFWESTDIPRTMQIIQELDIALIYVGQLETHLHSQGLDKLKHMYATGLLTIIYQNDKTIIYAVPTNIKQAEDGKYYPIAVTR